MFHRVREDGKKTFELIILELENNVSSASDLARKLKMRREVMSGYLMCMEDFDMVKSHPVGRSIVYTLKK